MMSGEGSELAFGLGRPDYVSVMHEQLESLVADRDQMGELLRVSIDIGSDLDLESVLHRIVNAAKRMTGAKYAALGVWADDGTLSAFLHAGLAPDVVAHIGHLPIGKGVLGELRERREPLRLTDLTGHPSAGGFPENHPPMRGFLGMPIAIRGEVYGSLYVTDDCEGITFAETDEVTLRALASAASIAIDNARLYERVRTAARWTSASREITTALLSGSEVDPLRLIAERASELADAEQAIVLVPVEPEEIDDDVESLVVSAAVGRYADEVLGQVIPIHDSTSGAVFVTAEPVITTTFRRPIQAFTDVGERPAIAMPLAAGGQTLGVIVLARNESHAPFDESYLDLARDFAGHATIALTLATAREYSRELSVLADRERIARDLHDRVIQRVFTVGLELQSAAARVHSPKLADRINNSIDELQQVINDIRVSIFELQQHVSERSSVVRRIQEAVARYSQNCGITPTLEMTGPLNTISAQLADDVEAVVIEALSNAARHSGADLVTIVVAVTNKLDVEITDNGCGISADNPRSSGLRNMVSRAALAGGQCVIGGAPMGGTRITWSVPLSRK